MERKSIGEEVHKISVSKVRKYFSGSGFASDDLVLSPLVRFQSLEGPPRVIDGIMIGVICNGTAKAVMNGRRYVMRPNSIFLLREDSVVESFRCSKACMGYLVTYSREFLDSINVDMSDFMSTYMMFGLRPCMTVDAGSVGRLHRMVSMLGDVSNACAADLYGYKIISSLFSAFFYTLVSIIAADAAGCGERRSRSEELLASFFKTLDAECESERRVEHYAAKLNITPKYLSLICKRKTGRNASKIIDDAVIHRAKSLLTQSGMSIQEVSDRLNFVSQSFFGKYFKQRVGISPSRYKVRDYTSM